MQNDQSFDSLITERDFKADKRVFSKIGAGFALFTVVTTVAAIVIQIIALLISKEFATSTFFKNLITPLSMYLFALPFLLIVLSMCPSEPPKKAKFGFGKWCLFLIVAFGAMMWGSEIGNGLMKGISSIVGVDYGNALESLVDNDELWISMIFMVIVAPIGEELVFRKLIIDRTHKYGAFVAVGLSALIFGLTHGNFYQFFYCLFVGIILGYVYYVSGNIILSIALHASLNFVGTVVVSLLIPTANALATIDTNNMQAVTEFVSKNALGFTGLVIYTAFMYSAKICAIVLPLIFFKKLKTPTCELAIPNNKIFSTTMLNVGMITLMAIYVFEFAINLLPIK